MGMRFKNQELGECFFITTSFYQHRRHGDTPGVYPVLAESLTYCLKKFSAKLPGFVFMPTHIHLLLIIEGKHLANFMRDFKKYVAQKGVRDCGVTDTTIWQARYDRVAVYSESVFRTKLDYIHMNPVKAGLVKKPQDWSWSSASAYLCDAELPLPVWKEWLF